MPNHPLNGLAARQAAGSSNVGKGDGSQFITGQCASDADCASKCCAGPKGACAAEAVANENGKNGCGFTSAAAGAGGASSKSPTSSAAASASSGAAAGSKNKVGGAASSQAASPTSSAAASASSAAAGAGASKNKAGAAAADPSKPGSQNVGKADGSQFITGQCTSDADCASGCCAKPKGVCSAEAVSNVDGKQGCGFTKA